MELKSLISDGVIRKIRGIPPRLIGRTIAAIAREECYSLRPAVLCNSLPKSGTHLLLQIMQALPGIREFGNFIASAPSRPNIERSVAQQLRMLRRITPGELTPAHLYYYPEVEELLQRRRFVHYFIYRDPRDVIISHMHHVTYMVPYHSQHEIFTTECATDEERISLAIKGLPTPRRSVEFPDIATRIGHYKDWIKHPNVFAIRFENLRSEALPNVIRRIIGHYQECTNYDFDVEAVFETALSAIKPKSHSFRSGQTEQWKKVFTQEHRRVMKDIAGPLLIELGYEDTMDW